MKLEEFDYELPDERIAQTPVPSRDSSRLLVLDRRSGSVEHRRFREIAQLLRPGDLLVLNDTRVVPARLIGTKPSGGRVELLRIEPIDGAPDTWRCLCRAARGPAPGTRIDLGGGLGAEVVARDGDEWHVRFHAADGDVGDALERQGRIPLPPYIHRPDGQSTADDVERYQTVYARSAGAVAAPTAGLHFTAELLDALRGRGVEVQTLTLHVGPGTFQPVRVEHVERHRLPAERFELQPAAARAVADARERGGRVVAVGTTVVRVLESRATAAGTLRPGAGQCRLYILPGHEFRAVDALITNFHLPRSTLLMLVCAFAGRERLLAAYRRAVEAEYRFYSYGDAMMVV